MNEANELYVISNLISNMMYLSTATNDDISFTA